MTVLEFAKEQGYETADILTNKWQGYTVYEPGFSDNEPHYIGLSYFILVKDKEMRLTTPDECFKCLAFMIEKKEFGNND